MLTDDEIKAIEARAEVVDAYVGWEQSRRGREVARQDVPALLADRRELLALAKELAEVLTEARKHHHERHNWEDGCNPHQVRLAQTWDKARTAGLLSEGK